MVWLATERFLLAMATFRKVMWMFQLVTETLLRGMEMFQLVTETLLKGTETLLRGMDFQQVHKLYLH